MAGTDAIYGTTLERSEKRHLPNSPLRPEGREALTPSLGQVLQASALRQPADSKPKLASHSERIKPEKLFRRTRPQNQGGFSPAPNAAEIGASLATRQPISYQQTLELSEIADKRCGTEHTITLSMPTEPPSASRMFGIQPTKTNYSRILNPGLAGYLNRTALAEN